MASITPLKGWRLSPAFSYPSSGLSRGLGLKGPYGKMCSNSGFLVDLSGSPRTKVSEDLSKQGFNVIAV